MRAARFCETAGYGSETTPSIPLNQAVQGCGSRNDITSVQKVPPGP